MKFKVIIEAEVNVWWEWFPNTIIDFGPSEFITVASSPQGLRPGGETVPIKSKTVIESDRALL
jgi:hypothetical protein